jgi:phosphatidylethanolamine/phosphatidyl-N-methylethanolamine N-methyltransferase
MTWLWISLGVLALGLFLYWALVVTEGAYLGRRVVALLYDAAPVRYDRVKERTWHRDRECLVTPLLEWLGQVRRPLILDVGTGTGRFPKAMLEDERFEGQIWGLDVSLGMLRRARDRLAGVRDRCMLMWGDADALPFHDAAFDAVACLEVLEFTPSPARTLAELMRVLRPGGVLLLTNRIGQARWFPGRAYGDRALVDLLSRHPLSRIEIYSWTTIYDQVWARKGGPVSDKGRGGDHLQDWVRNPERYERIEGIVQPVKRAYYEAHDA